jgi:hypothetical protein
MPPFTEFRRAGQQEMGRCHEVLMEERGRLFRKKAPQKTFVLRAWAFSPARDQLQRLFAAPSDAQSFLQKSGHLLYASVIRLALPPAAAVLVEMTHSRINQAGL